MINQERIRNLLLELVQIDSHSRRERNVAERIRQHCEDLGAEVEIDDAGEKVGGNSGNVIARFCGTIPNAEPIMMSAHMDTVVPGEGVKPVIDGDIIRTDGTTVLGGDDKSGCAVIIESIRCLKEQNIPHTDIEAVFSICEEVGLLGAKHLDVSKIRSRYGIVFDSDDPGFLFTRGPSSNHLEIEVHGLESHAGVAPEQGISAIRIAAEAITKMKLGRIDEETTANIGVIHGGAATNIIPNLVTLWGEARSLSEEKLEAQCAHMVQCFEEAAARYEVTVEGKTTRASVKAKVDRDYSSMDVPDSSRVVQLVKEAASRMGLKVETMASGGGCDANIFNRKGIECANLGTGMRAIHTVNEWLDVKDMYASAEMTLEILKLNGEMAMRNQG
ncbi:MAG TPA: M20/M25/M40 family metallo-hydrolase [Pyrinomonadaceae bacterium]|jgi:tripeptide aminopeptidase|nr:M20/M25/M40 family metallo-hydrolase [Pyrinomonadaceae bacterium]